VDKKWWTLLAVLAGTFMLLLDITIVIVALPDIQRSLHATFDQVQWVVDAYALTLASLLLTSGVLADRYGRRLVFTIGLVVFTVGSLLCGVAQSPVMLIASRSAQGVGGAIMFATSLALLAQTFHGRERGVAFGAWGAVTGVAVALGPILGGVISSGIDWRGIFLVNVPIGMVAIVITVTRVIESRADDVHRPDWVGFILLTVGLVVLVYGLTEAGETSWGSTRVLACLATGGAVLIGFLVTESLVEHPMFDLSLFRVPTFVGGSLAAFCMNASLFSVLLYLVLYLQDLLGYSPLDTGLRLLLTSGATLVAATIAGRLSGHVPVRWLIGPGLLLVGVGLVLMSGLSASSTWTDLIPGFVISGFGAGMVNPPLASTAVGVVEPERSGMASGINSTFRQIGIATSIAIQGSLFAAYLTKSVRTHLAANPALAPHTPAVVAGVRQGTVGQIFGSVAPSDRAQLGDVVRRAFTGGLNELLIFTAVVAFVGALGSFLLIRNRDFVASGPAAGEAGTPRSGGEQPEVDSESAAQGPSPLSRSLPYPPHSDGRRGGGLQEAATGTEISRWEYPGGAGCEGRQ
jgi:EmrB/QacA subfamily drug resistance transporter